MKKIVFMVAACALMASCNCNNKTNSAAGKADSTAQDSMATDSMVYEGTVPAADMAGINYRLAIAQDSSKSFAITETYMKSETDKAGSFSSSGQYKELDGKNNKKYYQLATGKGDTLTFLLLNDSALRMVSNNLEEPDSKSGLNYDLKLKK